jgi:hypothetical protein
MRLARSADWSELANALARFIAGLNPVKYPTRDMEGKPGQHVLAGDRWVGYGRCCRSGLGYGSKPGVDGLVLASATCSDR